MLPNSKTALRISKGVNSGATLKSIAHRVGGNHTNTNNNNNNNNDDVNNDNSSDNTKVCVCVNVCVYV